MRVHHPLGCHRYAFDVNIESLDVLNHKRLLDSARAEPSAVSFQVRPVDVITGTGIAGRVPSNSFLTEGSFEVRCGRGVVLGDERFFRKTMAGSPSHSA